MQLLKEWFKHPTYDAYWADEDCSKHFPKMNVPCFTVGSWYDFMSVGSIDSYVGRQHQGGPNSKGTQKLLIGPWLHGRFKETNKANEMVYPDNAKFFMDDHMIRWFDHYLKGVANGVEKDAVVKYYVMGAVGEKDAPGNVWKESADWPLKSIPTSYYLSAGGKLGLNPTTIKSSKTDFIADPVKPATIPAKGFPGGIDARTFESHDQVKTFTTEILDAPVEWTGKVQAEMFFSSDALDTDLIVRVSDVYPDGRSMLIIDYIRRVRYREGYDKEVFLEKGKVVKVAFDVGSLSMKFNKGHKIRVTIASTGAPFYEPNPNTGEPLGVDFPTNAKIANNSIHHEIGFQSKIIAPLIK
jgi:putative CocE/NonD family hydrolase